MSCLTQLLDTYRQPYYCFLISSHLLCHRAMTPLSPVCFSVLLLLTVTGLTLVVTLMLGGPLSEPRQILLAEEYLCVLFQHCWAVLCLFSFRLDFFISSVFPWSFCLILLVKYSKISCLPVIKRVSDVWSYRSGVMYFISLYIYLEL